MKTTVGLGILLTSLSYFLFTLHDGLIKLLVETTAVWQILFFRSVVILIGCLVFGGPSLVREAAASPVVKPMMLRSLLLLGAWLCYYNAAKEMQLAELTTLYYAAPIVATVLAVPVLREQVTLPRWTAVAVGFVGVLVATNLTSLNLRPPVYLALLAAFFWGLSTVLLRKTSMNARTLVQMIITNGFFLILTGTMLIQVWHSPNLVELALSLGTGIVGGIGQLAFFEGMRKAPISVLAPFEYTSLAWAFALGYAIWGDLPTPNVFFGAALICGAGLIIIFSERARSRR
ncbi:MULTISPECIES: DMT family transporter [Alphaproteobacteria]|uniref:Membrane protein n=2 Tax=Alphaproteobacteria TaxID=28211 RepID=A0A512HLA5_9HYPH|nr:MULTISPECIES: DMT family transporter [Alphaproteobacteria]GEO86180.1 membrane protein [Ciceribacter naphthalenivorans]GLR22747.1 membrane protein [Ciceribacter naphthalenivorans]GLT05603.1 membrane protein [Sphingomonas psychrolutea]